MLSFEAGHSAQLSTNSRLQEWKLRTCSFETGVPRSVSNHVIHIHALGTQFVPVAVRHGE